MAAAGLNLSLDDMIARHKPVRSGGKGGGGPGKAAPAGRASRRASPYSNKPVGRAAAPRMQPQAGKTVYVGNLSWDVSWQDLKDHFKSVGPVLHADVMMEPGTTRSKGCGLVTFANARDAASAITSLHDTELNGRLIFVREDRETGGAGGGAQAGTSVYVGNLSWDVSWQDLKDHFKSVGPVLHADVMMEPGTTRSKGCGLVTFAKPADAATAITSLHDTELNGRLIFVREDREGGASSGAPGRTGGAGAGTSVYVGNLSWDVSWQDLKDHFKSVGPVLHADVMMEPGTTRSKGCGLVTFANARDAASAISSLHDTELNGRLIFVREDREGGAGIVTRPVAPTDGCKLFVGNLPRESTWMDLKDLFREAGAVVRADVAQAADGSSKGYGTVLLGTTREAAKAIQMFNETDFNGRIIEVRPDARP